MIFAPLFRGLLDTRGWEHTFFVIGIVMGAFGQVTVNDAMVGKYLTLALDQAREKHEEAHVLWEYWTAENSDGFHNPALARESLTKSVEESRKGIKLVNDALEKKTASK